MSVLWWSLALSYNLVDLWPGRAAPVGRRVCAAYAAAAASAPLWGFVGVHGHAIAFTLVLLANV